MAFKALDGVLEFVGGLLLMTASVPQIDRWVWRLTADFGDGPMAHLAHWLRLGADNFSTDDKHFATQYLLIEGVIKLGLVVGLLRGVRWSYPVGLLLLALFCIYQADRLVHHYSWMLAGLAVVNLVVMALIAIEWRVRVAMRAI